MTAKEKRIQARLQQIKDEVAAYATQPKPKVADAERAISLAEEAAGLGLDLLEEKK